MEIKGELSNVFNSFEFKEDIEQIQINKKELVDLVEGFNGDTNFARISTILLRNTRRIQNCDPGTVHSQISLKNEALLQITNLKVDKEKLIKSSIKPDVNHHLN